MAQTELKIEGLDALYKALQELAPKVESNIMRGAVRAGAKVIEKEAKLQCPVNDPSAENKKSYAGALRDSIRVSMHARRGQVLGNIVAGNSVAYYAHMVEYGTAAHMIKPLNRKSLFIAGLMREVINHPGATKRPFMRPAFDNGAPNAFEAIGNYVKSRLEKIK